LSNLNLTTPTILRVVLAKLHNYTGCFKKITAETLDSFVVLLSCIFCEPPCTALKITAGVTGD